MEQYTVTGMSCAACAARVEKAVSGVEGVTSCSVSLLTNSMGVEGTAEQEKILEAVRNAGYRAEPKKRNDPASQKTTDCFPWLSDRSDVCFYGAHDVGLASAALLR